MKKLFFFLLTAFLLISCNNKNKSIAEKRVLVDDLGHKIETISNIKRIVTLAPSLTETIYFLGADSLLVGNTTFCNYPEEAKSVEKVASLINVDFEKILQLKPDLIFMTTSGNRKDVYDKLVKYGFKCYVFNPKTSADIYSSMLRIKEILNLGDKAERKLSEWKEKLDELKLSEVKKDKKLMFILSIKPLIVAGENTFIDEMIKINGYNNIAKGLKSNYPQLNREFVLKENPDILFVAPHGQTIDDVTKFYPEWKDINAVKHQKVVMAENDIYFRPGPRFIDAVIEMKEKVEN